MASYRFRMPGAVATALIVLAISAGSALAQSPADGRAADVTVAQVVVQDVSLYSTDVQSAIPGTFNAVAATASGYSCKWHTAYVNVRDGASFVAKMKSSSLFCYDGTQIVLFQPTLIDEVIQTGHGWINRGSSIWRLEGGLGWGHHTDRMRAYFEFCIPVVGCTSAVTATFDKTQHANGEVDPAP